jgi:hypothetical protein
MYLFNVVNKYGEYAEYQSLRGEQISIITAECLYKLMLMDRSEEQWEIKGGKYESIHM